MKRYIVRVWYDIEVHAESEAEARSIAYNVRIDVDTKPGKVEPYDSQVADCWEKEKS